MTPAGSVDEDHGSRKRVSKAYVASGPRPSRPSRTEAKMILATQMPEMSEPEDQVYRLPPLPPVYQEGIVVPI